MSEPAQEPKIDREGQLIMLPIKTLTVEIVILTLCTVRKGMATVPPMLHANHQIIFLNSLLQDKNSIIGKKDDRFNNEKVSEGHENRSCTLDFTK